MIPNFVDIKSLKSSIKIILRSYVPMVRPWYIFLILGRLAKIISVFCKVSEMPVKLLLVGWSRGLKWKNNS